MTWGTDFNTDIFLSRQSYSSKFEVEDKINELNELINNCEAQIKMYVSSTPKDITPPDFSEEQINWLNNQINEHLEMYREYLLERYRLELYLEHLTQKSENE
jgi:hypothetical protein